MTNEQFIACPKCRSIELVDLSNIALHVCKNCNTFIIESEMIPLKALSIKQPWAWLIVNGFKPLENRDNLKNFIGTFLVHSGKKFDFNWRYKVHPDTAKFIDYILEKEKPLYHYGGIIGSAFISGFVEESKSPWFSGKYGLKVSSPKPLPFTTCKGKLSFFKPEIY